MIATGMRRATSPGSHGGRGFRSSVSAIAGVFNRIGRYFALGLTVAAMFAGPATDRAIRRFAACGGFLEGITTDPRGDLWSLDVVGGRILQIDVDGHCRERGMLPGYPNGAKFGPDGSMIIAAGAGLYRFDTTSGTLARLTFDYQGIAVEGLNDLAFDGRGGLYVTAPGRSSILAPTGRVFYRAPTGEVRLLADGLAFPNGIAVAPDGETVLVSELAAKRIISLPSVDGKGALRMPYVFAFTAGGFGADGIGFGADGRLLAANLGARQLLVFSIDGQHQDKIDLPAAAGALVTNFTFRGDEMFVTEAGKGEIWRMPAPMGLWRR